MLSRGSRLEILPRQKFLIHRGHKAREVTRFSRVGFRGRTTIEPRKHEVGYASEDGLLLICCEANGLICVRTQCQFDNTEADILDSRQASVDLGENLAF